MGDLGQWLREAREARGLSLAEVEEVTRIRQHYLAALEADDWSSLPNETVGRGFLRNYALFLGLDAGELVARRQAEYASDGDTIQVMSEPRPIDYRPIEFDLKLEDESSTPWSWWVVVGLIALALIAGGWWLVTQRPDLLAALGPQPTATATATPTLMPTTPPTFTPPPNLTPVQPTATPKPGVFVLPTPTPAPSPTSVPVTPVSPSSEITSTQEIRLITRITERAWLRVVVDGQVMLETILEPGEEREWVGQQNVSVRSGNAGGVVILVGGEELGAMGAPGQVVERTWTWLDGRVVEQEPTVTVQSPAVGGGGEPVMATPTPIPTPTPAG